MMNPEKRKSKKTISTVIAAAVVTLAGSNTALENLKKPVFDKKTSSEVNANPIIYHFMKEIYSNILRLETIAPVIDDKFTKTRLPKKEYLLEEIKKLISRYKRLENVLMSKGIHFNASTYFLRLLESKPKLKVYLEHLENNI